MGAFGDFEGDFEGDLDGDLEGDLEADLGSTATCTSFLADFLGLFFSTFLLYLLTDFDYFVFLFNGSLIGVAGFLALLDLLLGYYALDSDLLALALTFFLIGFSLDFLTGVFDLAGILIKDIII